MLNSCEFGQLSNLMSLCILPAKSQVSLEYNFKGVLCFLVFHSRHNIQRTVDGYLNGYMACNWFLTCPSSVSGLLTSTERQLMGTLI